MLEKRKMLDFLNSQKASENINRNAYIFNFTYNLKVNRIYKLYEF